MGTPAKRDDERFMLGLAISAATLAPGQTRTVFELAELCNTTHQNITLIEHRALRKVRQRMRKLGLAKEFAEHLLTK